MAIMRVGTPVQAQGTRATDTCQSLRTQEAQVLGVAVASKRTEDISDVLQTLALSPRFAIPEDPSQGRRPFRRTYEIRFSDRQIVRRAQSYLAVIEGQTTWRRLGTAQNVPRRVRPGDHAGTIRSLLAIASAFPDLETPARVLARSIGDAVLATSTQAGIPAIPLAPAAVPRRRNPFMHSPLRRWLARCPALRQGLASGWLVTLKNAELHYAETARVGEAMIALTRETGEQRFVQWARNASAWYSRHKFVADIHANAMASGLDAELYTVSAEDKYLQRALERMKYGVLPAFDMPAGDTNATPFVRRLPLTDLADIARALVQLATALAAAPLQATDSTVVQRVNEAANSAHTMLQARALANRRLQLPTRLIELALDIERAQRAGAELQSPRMDAFRHVLAHGADRLERFIPLSGAASGLLLAKLNERGWSGIHRTAKASTEASTSAPALVGAQ